MKETEHCHLNQWSLDDRVRMQDFNADNAKLDDALAGLDSRVSGLDTLVSGLGTQVSGMGAQLDGMAAAEDLDAIQASLESKLGTSAVRISFQPSSDGSALEWRMGGLRLQDCAVFCLNLQFAGSITNTMLIQPILSVSGQESHCTGTGGETASALAAVCGTGTSSLIFFPLKSASAAIGTVYFSGNTTVGGVAGVGGTGVAYGSLSGFRITKKNGSISQSELLAADLYQIK